MSRGGAIPKPVKDAFDALSRAAGEEAKSGKNAGGAVHGAFQRLQRAVLSDGLGEPTCNDAGVTGFRGQVWKLFLGVLGEGKRSKGRTKGYQKLVETRPDKQVVEMIDNDKMRTLNSKSRQEEGLLTYEAFEPRFARIVHSHCTRESCKYLQGMNQLVCPFLVCMNEVDAFYSFNDLIARRLPTYWMPYDKTARMRSLTKAKGVVFAEPRGEYLGAYAAMRLADRLLQLLDPELYDAIIGMTRPMYPKCTGFYFHWRYSKRHFETLSSTCSPLGQVVQLWDAYCALGFHCNVLGYVAQLVILRNRIMRKGNTFNDLNRVLQQQSDGWEHLNARAVMSLVTFFIPQILRAEGGAELMRDMRLHGTDQEVCKRLIEGFFE